MQAIAWILLATLPLMAQRERPDRRVKDYSTVGADAPIPGAIPAEAPRESGGFRRYAVVMEQEPAAMAVATREALTSAAGRDHRQRVRASQSGVRSEMARRGLRELGSADVLVNAVFVSAGREDVEALAALPGSRSASSQRGVAPSLSQAIGASSRLTFRGAATGVTATSRSTL